ncbi:MAG: DUF3786 domain-containing protein [Proteobacteria bacterium]|nr:DUF3786 domain-containing protein [Pseudomonadota bacterium]
MKTEGTVFERTYKDYLEQLKGLSFESIAQKLGAKIEGQTLKIQLFNMEYAVSSQCIADPWGKKPSYDICVILCKYLLLCPDESPKKYDWVSFRDLKDSGPLINYFTQDVERSIASQFSGKIDDLKKASDLIGAYPSAIDVKYDISLLFNALPKIPVMMLYNDTDDEFSATCSVLFEQRVEAYLDAECIAMLGRHLFNRLKMACHIMPHAT